MAKPVFFKAILNPEKGLFDLIISGDGQGQMTMELPPDQFLAMATYFAKVGASYQEWLKGGGQLGGDGV